MPLHDWTNVEANDYYFFHTRWLMALCDHLNGGLLPSGYSASGEQVVLPHVPYVLTLKSRKQAAKKRGSAGGQTGGTAVLEKPKTRAWQRATEETVPAAGLSSSTAAGRK